MNDELEYKNEAIHMCALVLSETLSLCENMHTGNVRNNYP